MCLVRFVNMARIAAFCVFLPALPRVFTGVIINAFQHDANDGQTSKDNEEYSDGSDEEVDSKSIEH
jgi:hypothetical protein